MPSRASRSPPGTWPAISAGIAGTTRGADAPLRDPFLDTRRVLTVVEEKKMIGLLDWGA
jgi:hypothetical protein